MAFPIDVRFEEGQHLRIAILGSRGYPSTYGGFETLVRRLAPFLADRGHEVTVYARRPAAGQPRVDFIDGVRVVHSRGVETKIASTLSYGFSAAVHASRERPDAVLVLNVANGFANALLRARGIPTVVNVDGIEWERAKWGRVARATFLAGAKLSNSTADLLIADSRHLGRIWQGRFGASPRFIPYGADIIDDGGSERVTALGLNPGTYALAVARLAPENNVELFVEAMQRLSWKVPAVVVGSANYDNPLSDELARLHEQGRLLWLGHVADQTLLNQLWGNAGVYFHGHSVGGTNPALLQALGCGAPTLAVRTEFNREVLGADDQLVDPDGGVIAREIGALLSDADRRRELRQRGRRIVASDYRWDQVCLAYLAALFEVSARHGTRSLRAAP
jgi:glycosyltransferase involved in cell wall biosynthesis